MSISLTINASDANDLRRQLSELLGSAAVAAVVDPQPSPPKATAQRAAPKAETPASDPSPEPSATSQTNQSEATTTEADGGAGSASPSDDEDAGDAPTYTYEDHIKPSVLKVSAKHGRPGVEKLLTQFGVANAREVPEEKWPEFMAEIEKLLG